MIRNVFAEAAALASAALFIATFLLWVAIIEAWLRLEGNLERLAEIIN